MTWPNGPEDLLAPVQACFTSDESGQSFTFAIIRYYTLAPIASAEWAEFIQYRERCMLIELRSFFRLSLRFIFALRPGASAIKRPMSMRGSLLPALGCR